MVDFSVILRLCSGYFWDKKELCEGVSVVQSPKIVDWCFTKEIRWLSSYPKSPVLQNIANHYSCSCRLSGAPLKWLFKALLLTDFGVKGQDVDLQIAS